MKGVCGADVLEDTDDACASWWNFLPLQNIQNCTPLLIFFADLHREGGCEIIGCIEYVTHGKNSV